MIKYLINNVIRNLFLLVVASLASYKFLDIVLPDLPDTNYVFCYVMLAMVVFIGIKYKE